MSFLLVLKKQRITGNMMKTPREPRKLRLSFNPDSEKVLLFLNISKFMKQRFKREIH